jgi:hypothetical protein
VDVIAEAMTLPRHLAILSHLSFAMPGVLAVPSNPQTPPDLDLISLNLPQSPSVVADALFFNTAAVPLGAAATALAAIAPSSYTLRMYL